MSLSKQVKTALDETRLLMLGAQVLFGFKLNGVFQEEFAHLSLASRYVDCAGQVLMAVTIGLLVAPSMQHRIVEDGEDTDRIHRITASSSAWRCCRLPSVWAWAFTSSLIMYSA
jgi:hypothetical protein